MKNKKPESLIIILCGLVCIFGAMYVYTQYTPILYDPNARPRMRLVWLVDHLGKTGTAILFSLPGLILVYSGISKMRGK